MFDLPVGRPAIMGILNVTEDSFSDGGRHFEPAAAIAAGLRMRDEGADLIDVGGESTRPGADPISAAEELRRVIPVISALAAQGVKVSIDTMKAEVASAALAAGAVVVNDVMGLRGPGMLEVVAAHQCPVCIMHMQGSPRTMQSAPQYDDVVREVRAFLLRQAAVVEEAGLPAERVWIDPGIGFGKTVEHNLKLLNGLGKFVATGYPVLLGVSRKSFIGRVLGGEEPLPIEERSEGAQAVHVWAQIQGVRVLRVHDVAATARTIRMIEAIAQGVG